MTTGPAIDADRVIDDLGELDRRTGGPGGARRLCWGEGWREARWFLAELLGGIGVEADRDPAGNLWATLAGNEGPVLALGSHLDSVPGGGWLDGALGVMAALGVLRAWAEAGEAPPRPLTLLDWADEEGARFGRSLFGSSAFSGSIEGPGELRRLRDGEGNAIADVLAANGVELARVQAAAAGSRPPLGAYLELHIEQGPVLEVEGRRAAAVSGCAGVERHRLRFRGQASHAGTTPMDRRRDAGLAAAESALRIEEIALRRGGVATAGALALAPGIATAVAGEAELVADLRHPDARELAAMLAEALEGCEAIAERRACELATEPVWRIEPLQFDPALVSMARATCLEVAGSDRVLASGALHDAAEVSRVAPVAMVFCPSTGGISHAPEEDTPRADLSAAIEAFGALANRALIAIAG